MIVNLNVKCKVILNELGKKVWLNRFHYLSDEFKEAHPEILDALESAIGKDDSVEAPLWEIMSVFGPYLSMTSNPFNSTTIELQKALNFMSQEEIPNE